MNTHYAQIYEIIGHAARKTAAFGPEYVHARTPLFEWYRNFVIKSPLFNDLTDDQREDTAYECFPLHPVTAFLLPRLSELVAQNERTMFTFLCSQSKFTLPYYLENSGQIMLTPDMVYDYFEPLLKREPYISEVHRLYANAHGILSRLEADSLDAKIVKTLLLIDIVNQFDRCPPTPDTIIDAFEYVYSKDAVAASLHELETQKLLVYAKKSNGYLRIISANIDVRRQIRDEVQRRMSMGNAQEILEDFTSDIYLYPMRYNDENAMIRYFDFHFLYGDQALSIRDWDRRADEVTADGIVYAVLPRSEEQIEKLHRFFLSPDAHGNRVLFMLPKFFSEMDEIVYTYQAVSFLMKDAGTDTGLSAEYEIYLEDMTETLEAFIRSFTMPELNRTDYFYCGEKLPVYRKAQLSQQLSAICERVFPGTPVINNETLNKNDLTPATVNSRSKVIAGLLAPELPPCFGLTGNGQDMSILRSAFLSTGIIENLEKPEIHIATCPNERLRAVLQRIDHFFASCMEKEGTSFSVLYDQLIRAEYGIGMKRGPIPLYIAAVMRSYRNKLSILSNGQEMELNADLLNRIDEKPDAYTVRLIDWNDGKAMFLTQLTNLFSEYLVRPDEQEISFAHIVRAMQGWLISLPKYAKEAKKIYDGNGMFHTVDKSEIRFVNSLKTAPNYPYAFLFEKVPLYFNHNAFVPELIDEIRRAKNTFDTMREHLTAGLERDLTLLFAPDAVSGMPFLSAAKDWYAKLSERTIGHLFDGSDAQIFTVFSGHVSDSAPLPSGKMSDSASFILDLARPAAGLRMDDWSNDTIPVFLQTMSDFKKHVMEFDRVEAAEDKGSMQDAYTLTTRNEDGTARTRTFDRVTYTPMAKLLKNEIISSLEDMGQAISESEKRQVLIEVLQSLC